MNTSRTPLAERFFSKTKRAAEPLPGMATPCLEWQAAKVNGYGRIGLSGNKTAIASRVAWELKHGSIPNGLHVCHRCDNPACVDTDHLFLGTDADNAADMVAKNRQSRGDRSGARMHPEKVSRGEKHRERMRMVAARGERNGQAKLTESDVTRVFRMRTDGMLMKDIGEVLGVKINAICRILNRKRWAHVQIQETNT